MGSVRLWAWLVLPTLAIAGCRGLGAPASGLRVERVANLEYPASAFADGALPPMATADDMGRVYLLAGSPPRILVYDSAGAPAVDARDGGVSLAQPTHFTAEPDGTLGIFDRARRGLVVLRPGGAQHRVGLPQPPQGERIALSGLGAVAVFGELRSSEGEIHYRLARVEGSREQVLGRLTRPLPSVVDYEGCGVSHIRQRLFERQIVWDERDGVLAAVFGPEYRIERFRDGVALDTLVREVAPRAVSEAMAAREVGEDVRFEAGVATCRATRDQMAASRGWAETVPEIADLRIAPGGDIWVLRGAARGEEAAVEVFAADGRFLGAMPNGTPFPGAFTGPDSFVARVEGGLATFRIVR
ncbi:MAG TPA: hypothetical protein VK837_06500 [Longimicrobiales bacterium]|nr:hypothetical protein [Longimicrobiales bacterium]